MNVGRVQRPQTLTGIALAKIREAIVSGPYALGEQLSEATLAASLGISKTPVREALLRLQTAALAEAMRNCPEELLSRLAANLGRIAQANDTRDLKRLPLLDQEFHETIIACSGNAYLQASYQLIGYQIRALRARLPEENERVGQCLATHSELVRQIRTADVAKSQRLLAAHIQDTLGSYLSASRNLEPPTRHNAA